jgi:Ni2+-binding GTPase involved in maturation of urease and hydrogenase
MDMTATTAPTATPVTVFTGFLGAGKTSVILSLLPRLPKDYKVVLLKNEFGDVEGLFGGSHRPSPRAHLRSGQQARGILEPDGCERDSQRLHVRNSFSMAHQPGLI